MEMNEIENLVNSIGLAYENACKEALRDLAKIMNDIANPIPKWEDTKDWSEP